MTKIPPILNQNVNRLEIDVSEIPIENSELKLTI